MKINYELIKKWSGTGLLEGIEDDLRKNFVATNLEEAAKWLVKLANDESRNFQYSESFAGIVLPVVNRVSRTETFDIPIVVLLEKLVEIITESKTFATYFLDDWTYQLEDHLVGVHTGLLKRIISIEKAKS